MQNIFQPLTTSHSLPLPHNTSTGFLSLRPLFSSTLFHLPAHFSPPLYCLNVIALSMSGGSGSLKIICTQMHSTEARQQRLALSTLRCLHNNHWPKATPLSFMQDVKLWFWYNSGWLILCIHLRNQEEGPGNREKEKNLSFCRQIPLFRENFDQQHNN